MEHNPVDFVLPTEIISPADVVRLRRELALLNGYFESQQLRDPEMPASRLPKISQLLDELAEQNKVNLLHATARRDLSVFLERIDQAAPVVHISFAVDPPVAALRKIVVWLRTNVQPQVLVKVGLQPAIAAGCTIQTTNRYFDFSLRQYLFEHRSQLTEALKTAQQTVPTVITEASHEQ